MSWTKNFKIGEIVALKNEPYMGVIVDKDVTLIHEHPYIKVKGIYIPYRIGSMTRYETRKILSPEDLIKVASFKK